MHIKIKDSKAYYQESRTLNLLTLWQSTSNLIKTRQSNASPEMLIEACVSFTWLQAGLKRLPELMLLQLWGNIERMFWTTGVTVVIFTAAALLFSYDPVQAREFTSVYLQSMFFTFAFAKGIECFLWLGHFFIERYLGDIEIQLHQAGIEKLFIVKQKHIYLEV